MKEEVFDIKTKESYFQEKLPFLTIDALFKALGNTEQEELEKIIRARKGAFFYYVFSSDGPLGPFYGKTPDEAAKESKECLDKNIEELNDSEKRVIAYFAGVRKSILALTNSTK